MRVSYKTLAAAALALTFAACDSRMLALDDLGPEIIAASCRLSVMCDQSPDRATCLASSQIRESLFETMQADIAAGIVKYDGRAARACVDTYAGIGSCTFTAVIGIQTVLDATCGKVFTGTLPPGSACFFSEECANKGTCDRSCPTLNGCCEGTCVAPPASVAAGGDCTPADTLCVDGTRCVTNTQGTSPLLICQPELGPGAACNASADTCAIPFSCLPPDPVASLAGTCTAPPATGETCGGTPGLGSICNDLHDVCDSLAFVCVRSSPVGGSCATTACVGDAVCDGATCIARGGPGASCDPVLTSPCLAQLECDATMHCTLPPKGASCR